MPNLYALSGPDSITVYWDLPARPAPRYDVLVDGVRRGSTGKTHFTLRGLAPDAAYEIEVRPVGRVRACTEPPKRRLDVTAPPFGAVGDGCADDTAALQRAFDACGAGDCVYFPAGVYRSGALFGHSDMELYLEKDAVLQGSDRPEDYEPRIRSRFEGTEMECCASLLNFGTLDHAAGPNCQNVRIWGEGTIRGGGYALAWATIQREKERMKDQLAAMQDLVRTCENENTLPGRVRGRLVNLSNCRHVRIAGLTLADGPSWNVHMIYCRDIVTDHCTFRSEGIWNGDGWDPDSSEDCTLFASVFCTQDDAVAVKSGKNPEGNAIGRPTRRVRVFDCRSVFGHGICIGSEISGGIEDVAVWDCDLANSQYGIMVKGTRKRGGGVRGLAGGRGVVPGCIDCHGAHTADGAPGPGPPVFRDFRFEDLTLTGRCLDADQALAGGEGGGFQPCVPLQLEGFDGPGCELQDVVFRRLALTGGGTLQLGRCKGVSLEEIDCV